MKASSIARRASRNRAPPCCSAGRSAGRTRRMAAVRRPLCEWQDELADGISGPAGRGMSRGPDASTEVVHEFLSFRREQGDRRVRRRLASSILVLDPSPARAATCPEAAVAQRAAEALMAASRSGSPSAFASALRSYADMNAITTFALGKNRSKVSGRQAWRTGFRHYVLHLAHVQRLPAEVPRRVDHHQGLRFGRPRAVEHVLPRRQGQPAGGLADQGRQGGGRECPECLAWAAAADQLTRTSSTATTATSNALLRELKKCGLRHWRGACIGTPGGRGRPASVPIAGASMQNARPIWIVTCHEQVVAAFTIRRQLVAFLAEAAEATATISPFSACRTASPATRRSSSPAT